MNRIVLIAGVVVALTLAAAYFAYDALLLDGGESTTAVTTSSPRYSGRVTLVRAVGEVESSTSPEVDRWMPIQTGDIVSLETSVRTASGGVAELELTGGSRIILASESQLTLHRDDAAVTRFELHRGRIQVEQKADGRDLRIDAPKTDAAVTSSEGSFMITTDGLGTLAVAVTAGNAILGTPEKESVINAGEQSVAFTDGSISAATPIPASLLLKVRKVPKSIRKKRIVVIEGKTEPGARVMVASVNASADSQGRFRIAVPLREGSNDLIVRSEAVSGKQTAIELPPILLDTHAPGTELEMRWE